MSTTLSPHRICMIMLGMMLVLGGGCTDNTSNNNNNNYKLVCETEVDCAPGLACTDGLCDAQDERPRDLIFTFIPSTDGAHLPQRTQTYTITPGDDLAFELQPSLTVQGTLSRSDAPGLLNGTLIFERTQDDRSLYTRQVQVQQGEYSASIVSGTYDITFVPDTQNVPPKTWSQQVFTLNSEFSRTIGQPRMVRGTVSYRALDSETVDVPLYVPQARVVAISKETGKISTSTVTDIQGFFDLSVWPDTGEYDILVAPMEGLALVPQVVFRDIYDSSKTASQTTLSLNLGTLPRFPVEVVLSLDLGEQEPDFDQSDLRMRLNAPMGNGELSISTPFAIKEALTESKRWDFGLSVLPGTYNIELIPPVSSRFARTQLTQNLDGASAMYALSLNTKRPIQTQLLYRAADGQQRPLTNATMHFKPKNASSDEFTMSSDEDGRVFTSVDALDYDVEVVPEPRSGLARGFYSIKSNTTKTLEVFEWILPEPTIISGTVYDSGYTPQSDIAVQIHEVIDGERRLIVEGQTSAQGSFTLPIPSSP